MKFPDSGIVRVALGEGCPALAGIGLQGGSDVENRVFRKGRSRAALPRDAPPDPKGETLARVRLEEGHAHGPGNHKKMKIIQFSINIDKFTVFFDKFLKMIPMKKR